MSNKFYLSLLFLPLLGHAEVACLEDPTTGKCYPTNLNAEVFKSADNRAVAKYEAPTISIKKSPSIPSSTAKKQATPKTNGQMIAEQRIAQRAKIIEERANKRQFRNR